MLGLLALRHFVWTSRVAQRVQLARAPLGWQLGAPEPRLGSCSGRGPCGTSLPFWKCASPEVLAHGPAPSGHAWKAALEAIAASDPERLAVRPASPCQGVKEVTLLGQNVNSYRDTSEAQFLAAATPTRLSHGFSTVYKAKRGGLRFAELLDRVSAIDPEMRIRFTSPHPKDFPDEVFELMRERLNICKQLHLPVQSGSTRVLEAMRRGYTREAYLELVHHVRDTLPGVHLSSDFITGFCGETEAEHLETVSLMREVRYHVAFIFAYSERQKTRAFHRLQDDVLPEVKQRRLRELAAVFREEAAQANAAAVGCRQVVLVEGLSKRSTRDLCGRNDGNVKVIFPDVEMEDGTGSGAPVRAQPGDYVLVEISSANSQTLRGAPLRRTSLKESAALL